MYGIWAVIFAGLLSVVYGVVTSSQLLAADGGSPRMQEIAGAVRAGAQAYLKRQYTTIAAVGFVIFLAYGLVVSWTMTAGFLIGAVFYVSARFNSMVLRAWAYVH